MEGKYISYRVCGTQWANNNLLCASNSLFISRTGFSRLIFFLGTFVEQRSGGAPLPYAIISQMQLQTSARARAHVFWRPTECMSCTCDCWCLIRASGRRPAHNAGNSKCSCAVLCVCHVVARIARMPLMPRNYVKSGFAEYLYMHVIHVIHVSLYYIIIMNASFFCYSVVCCNCLMGICIVFLFVVVCSFAVFALALCCVCVTGTQWPTAKGRMRGHIVGRVEKQEITVPISWGFLLTKWKQISKSNFTLHMAESPLNGSINRQPAIHQCALFMHHQWSVLHIFKCVQIPCPTHPPSMSLSHDNQQLQFWLAILSITGTISHIELEHGTKW